MPIRELPEELQKKTEKELNETPQRRTSDIDHIKDWLSKQPHLNVISPDDQMVLNFLRGCKFRAEKTKQKMDYYYSTKTIYRELFDGRDPLSEEMQYTLNAGRYWLPLPKSKNPLAPRTLLYQSNPYKPSEKLNPVIQMKTILMVMDVLVQEDDSFVINGFQVIQFLPGLSLQHLTEMSPNLIRMMYLCTLKRYPARMKGLHFVNIPSAGYALFKMAKPLISEKIQSRIHFHQTNDYSDLYKIIPKSDLPKELGGESYTISDQLAKWNDIMLKCRSWFLENEKLRSDESKRIAKWDNTELFGVEGSFRKLDID
ncbi:alpha-tocopherol transfer protein-like isoform X2 [Photinus pyralis]|uniref:CRAL-TRIO domain-containing protein n=1 Tax=Photinus pyralis TaxID=7054 RepID=A0A1Y1KP10_PHOPY|nr:alpha-tocopherol transfer protein-like isoform X2 [Photinus pyralis]